MLRNMIQEYVTIAGMGIAIGGGMCGIVIMLDYVITSIFTMMMGRCVVWVVDYYQQRRLQHQVCCLFLQTQGSMWRLS